MKISLILSIIITAIAVVGIFSLKPDLVCVDGWSSPSIGSRGACSSHGGVDSTPLLNIFIFLIGLGLGVAFYMLTVDIKLFSYELGGGSFFLGIAVFFGVSGLYQNPPNIFSLAVALGFVFFVIRFWWKERNRF